MDSYQNVLFSLARFRELTGAYPTHITVVGHAFNFSTEVKLSALEIVRHLLRLMRSPLEPDVRGEATNEIKHQYLCSAKARS